MARSSKISRAIYIYFLAVVMALVYSFNSWVVAPDGLPYANALRIDLFRNLLFAESITDVSDMFPETIHRSVTDYIIVHHDAIEQGRFGKTTPIHLISQYHKVKYGTFAYHYYITASGRIYRMHDEREATPHALSYNFNSVSVCLSGNFNIEQPTEKQYSAYIMLMQYLRMRYPNANILGHYETGNETDCPGFYFDFKNFSYE